MAWLVGTLSTSGALAGWMVGILVLNGTGWQGGAVLAAFFISSSLVSRVGSAAPSVSLDPKGDRRDAWQVCANGGPAALGALLAGDASLRMWVVTASLAAAAADTWATSVGYHSRVPPRLLGTGRRVSRGTSGGITILGLIGAGTGAALVAGTAALAQSSVVLFAVGTLIGFLGMLVDSVAGGTIQGRFHCDRCDVPSERRVHRCGGATVRKAGFGWLTNDGVNLFATSLAAWAGWAAWRWLD